MTAGLKGHSASLTVVRAETASDSQRNRRTELQVLLDFVQLGDTLLVTRIDRLARSMKDLRDIVQEPTKHGVALRATEQPVDTGTAAGEAFPDMLGVFAEFGTNLRRERQFEGIKAARAKDVYKCRKATINAVELRRLPDDEKLDLTAIARRLSVGRASVYRVLGKAKVPASAALVHGPRGNYAVSISQPTRLIQGFSTTAMTCCVHEPTPCCA